VRPADLLACQADLVHRFDVEDFCEIIVGSVSGPYLPADAFKQDEHGLIRTSKAQQDQWRERVPDWIKFESTNAFQTWARFGMMIEVTEHMVDLINWVANEFDELDHVDLDLAPAPYGMVHFAKPVKAVDVHGEELWTDWMVWGPIPGTLMGQRAMGVLSFNDMVTGPDPQAVVAMTEAQTMPHVWGSMRHLGRWAYSSFTSLLQDERMGPQEWPVDDLIKTIRRQGGTSLEKRIVPTRNLTRFVYALWTVMNQPIAVLEKQEPDRATKRRMTRMKIPPAVTVITLRRPDNPHRHDEDGHVEWNHHWLVRGHPRWQAYGPQRSERKLIWVNPHFKGNMDAPLHQSDKIYRVSR
jgi:hypothetical protein